MLEVLFKLDCTFPKRSIPIGLSVAKYILWTRSALKTVDISTMKPLDDRKVAGKMQLLDKLLPCMYGSGDSRLPLLIFQSLSWSIKRGYCEYSPAAFASTALLVMHLLGDYEGGYKCGQQALDLLKKVDNPATAARTLFVVNSFIVPWIQPMRTVLKRLVDAYDIGFQTG